MAEKKTLDCLPDELRAFGDSPAMIALGRDAGEEISYRSLADDADAIGRGLAALGIERGEHVGIFASASPEWITACCALLRIAAVPVPIDTQIEREQLERILEDASIDYVFADETRAGILEDIDFGGRALRLDQEEGDRSWRVPAGDGEDIGPPKPEDVALLFYTSGTTGPPKGVPLEHRHLRFQVDAIEAAGIVGSNDRLLLPLPLHHVYPLVIGVMVPLSLGLPIVLPQALTGPEFLRATRETGATVICGVPRLYAALAEGLDSRIGGLAWPLGSLVRAGIAVLTQFRQATGINAGRVLLKPLRKRLGESLRILASGGSPLSPDLARRLNGLGFDVAVGYGLTETAPILTFSPPGSRRVESVGKPVEGVEIRIDEDKGPEGEEGRSLGEILARGPGIFEGYLNLDDETDEVFTDEGWFRTGDLGWMDDDGYLYVHGRKSTMIVTASGENLRTEALEETYAKHRLIEEIGILKAGDKLAAVIYPDTSALKDETVSADSAVDSAVGEITSSLPSYQRLDTYRITNKPLERTRLGKIKRHKLEERFEDLQSDGKDEAAEPVSVGDMSKSDRRLLQSEAARKTWELLARRWQNKPLSPDSNFRLELGVDSLGWLDLSMEIARKTGIELDEEQISGIDTVRDLLEVMAEGKASEGELREPLANPESVLSDEQKRWLEHPPKPARWLAGALYALNRAIMKLLFRIDTSGRIETGDKPVVIAPNHASFLDPFAVAAALPRDVLRDTHWGGWTGYTLRNRVFRGVSRMAGVIPVDPGRAMISSLAFAIAVLKKERHLVWFPEGERSRDGELKALRPGLGAILEACDDVRVVPVRIDGAYDAWPRGKRWPRLRKIRVRFGEARSRDELEDRGDGESKRERIIDGLQRLMKQQADD